MNSILNNELVLKYFGTLDSFGNEIHRHGMAERVLLAMQEPISKGDKVLVIPAANQSYAIESGHIWEYEYPGNVTGIHCQWLRLPDKFQLSASVGQKKECYCVLHKRHPEWRSYACATGCACHTAVPKRKCDYLVQHTILCASLNDPRQDEVVKQVADINDQMDKIHLHKDEVEEKIRWLNEAYGQSLIEDQLRELIHLARGGK